MGGVVICDSAITVSDLYSWMGTDYAFMGSSSIIFSQSTDNRFPEFCAVVITSSREVSFI